MSLIEKWWKLRKSKASAAERTPEEPEHTAAMTEAEEEPAEPEAEKETAETASAEPEAEKETTETASAEPEAEKETAEPVSAEPEAEEKCAEDAPESIGEEDVPEEDIVAVEEEVVSEEDAEIIEEEIAADAEIAEVTAEEVVPEEAPGLPEEEISEESTESDPLDALEPADVFKYFREIAAIPHGSYQTAELSNYLENFAKEHSLSYIRDEMGNLIISKPGSAGFEDADPIALQGHIDMVCEKETDHTIDMEKEAITLQTDGEWLWADRTTLGGDDGIAVAIMLALLSDDSLVSPPLECVFTVDEEVGLLGAEALDLSELRSRRMINLDSESEGVITAACAGGAEVILTLHGKRREKKGEVLEISIDGLRGGHSGERINQGRANADLLMARLLYRLEKMGKYCIIGFNGGTRDNAIPRSAKADILFTETIKRREIKEMIAAFAKDIAREYSVTDPDIRIRAKWPNKGKKDLGIAFSKKDSRRLVRFLMALPNGVIEYSPLYTGIPRTSLNLGILKTMADGAEIHTMVRSSINSQKKMLLDRIESIAEQFGASYETQGTYPAWELIERSEFRDLAADVYQQVTGKEPVVCVIHGGLECGLLAAKVSGLDCISLGPDMDEVHTPSERLSIPSSERTYKYIRELLKACTQA